MRNSSTNDLKYFVSRDGASIMELFPLICDFISFRSRAASDSRLPPPRPRRGHVGFKASAYPVRVPTAHRLLEAYVRLIARTHGAAYEYFFMSMVNYIEDYVDRDGYLDDFSLESRCKAFYSGLKNSTKPIAILLEELHANFDKGVP